MRTLLALLLVSLLAGCTSTSPASPLRAPKPGELRADKAGPIGPAVRRNVEQMLHGRVTVSSAPGDGQVFTFDATNGWQAETNAGSDQDLQDLAGLTRNRGDMIRGGASAWEDFAIGADNLLLASNGTDPGWQTLTTLIDEAIGSTRGSVLYRGASGWAILAPGTATHVLTSNGAGADPSYAAISAAIGGTAGEWTVDASGDLVPVTDNADDLGDATFRPRTVRAGTSVITPLLDVPVTGAMRIGSDTTGIRLEVNSGRLDLREGDDSDNATATLMVGQGNSGAPTLALGVPTAGLEGGSFSGTYVGINVGTRQALFYNRTSGPDGLIVEEADGTYGLGFGDAQNGVMMCASYGGRVTLTDATTTTVAVIDLDAGERCGGFIHYVVEATDGTDHQVVSGSVRYAAENKGGVFVTSIGGQTESDALSSGTLANTWSITTSASDFINVRLTSDTSLTPTTIRVQLTVCESTGQDVDVQ